MKWIFFLFVIGIFLYAVFSPNSPLYSRLHPVHSDYQNEVNVQNNDSDSSQTSLESNILNTLDHIKN